MEGTKVKTPFDGKRYMSDARHFRAVGIQSSNLSIYKNKAQLEAKRTLAQQVQTNLKVVSDAYAQELVGNQAAEAIERFETLAREVTTPLVTCALWVKTFVNLRTKRTRFTSPLR